MVDAHSNTEMPYHWTAQHNLQCIL
jgi:hypothetical protein